MKIYKLKYKDKAEAIKDLLARGIYVKGEDEQLTFGQGVHAIVEIGLIVLTEATYDEDFKELTAPIYADGYHFDLMVEQELTFPNEITPNSPRHVFAGY